MRHRLFLAWLHLRHHRVRSAILLACLTLSFCLPLASHWLVREFDHRLSGRAQIGRATPLIVGARGSRFDLVLHALHFRPLAGGGVFDASELARLRAAQTATPVPLCLLDFKSRRGRAFPIVGTTLDYFELRRLVVASGEGLTMLGDCVLGAGAADALGVAPGGTLTPDPRSLSDLSSLPLKLSVAGVLAPTRTADDDAIFVDIKTAWVLAGLGHGHDPATADPAVRLPGAPTNQVVFNDALPVAGLIQPENLASFHFHGDLSRRPLTAILALPHSERDSVLLQGDRAYLSGAGPLQALVPAQVAGQMVEMALRVKRYVDAHDVVVAVGTVLFLSLMVLLSLRLRREEMETLFALGCSRGTMFALQALELLMLLAASAALAAALAWAFAAQADRWMRGAGL